MGRSRWGGEGSEGFRRIGCVPRTVHPPHQERRQHEADRPVFRTRQAREDEDHHGHGVWVRVMVTEPSPTVPSAGSSNY